MANFQDLENAAEICREQCKILVEAFRTVRSPLSHELNQGIQLLASCRVNGWIVRTLLRAESRMEFREICRFLELDRAQQLSQLRDAAQRDRCHLLLKANGETSISAAESFALRMVKSLLQEEGLRYTDEGLPIDFLIRREVFPQKHPRFIASGSNGAVYSVKWLGQEFAIKTIKCGSPSYRQEVKFLLMKHPNVLSIIGYCYNERDMCYSIVMEKMATSLQLMLHKLTKGSMVSQLFHRSGPLFGERVKVLLMLQIARGMEFLHSEGLLHLDLKPSNILVANSKCEPEQMVLKIGDFGSSRMVNEIEPHEARNPFEGTRGYRAPDTRYSEKVDVFSYGMTCYELVSGNNQFTENDRSILSGSVQPALPPSCNAQLQNLLNRCWSQEPRERPTFAEIVSELVALRNDLQV